MSAKLYLVWFLAMIAFGFFVYGIILAVHHTYNGSPGLMPDYLSTTATNISLVLATNLGVVLGIYHNNASSELRRADSWKPRSILLKQNTTATRILACYLYIIALFVIIIVWATRKFAEDPSVIVPLIPEMAKSFVGIAAGALAACLKE